MGWRSTVTRYWLPLCALTGMLQMNVGVPFDDKHRTSATSPSWEESPPPILTEKVLVASRFCCSFRLVFLSFEQTPALRGLVVFAYLNSVSTHSNIKQKKINRPEIPVISLPDRPILPFSAVEIGCWNCRPIFEKDWQSIIWVARNWRSYWRELMKVPMNIEIAQFKPPPACDDLPQLMLARYPPDGRKCRRAWLRAGCQ